ncbi:glycoside hydrolase family 15 protein [Paenarthrobacter aurescens]|uniref:Trehalase n=1 Tax=Paenarthrobacter aurescens TaxID=43663 RepID=A0A4Y3NCH4_PAEAU|nr:glycoside hydrolase family 15 protein [Paenarthrobacter aurescens]MDO6145432.1 glycoside hydrolase family 15 protein [Paenarthrobacter aurescens]MDO6149237.1 glycoside hydrolase family 15 protein [Paenarthrobacter aurescens]MDO6160481.1 glycoside hydrolase family 15 protein [Paenarthrobacter aurescens]MDO6164340.1 glycoside hydrolase family 15 protein [Paenarthrobacter aurescens]GEB19540.1 glucoamylase [Paenarthrobacter aurescens]
MAMIEDYAIIGDLNTAAMVGRSGSIDWMCLPRFDSPACFASLLHNPDAGRWLLAPAGTPEGGNCTRRQYREDTLILETEWEVDGGSVRVIDFMPVRDDAVDLVRIVEGLSGEVTMQMELVLRFDYGRVVPWVRHSEHGISAVAGPDSAYLTTPVTLEGRDKRTVSEFTVRAGERVPFVLRWAPSHVREPRRIDPFRAVSVTEKFWLEWISRSEMTGKYKEPVERSLITLKALTYAPTGGIVAAATTSLPEQLGGPRNWDYRYCWLRDATLTLQSLLAAGYTEEASAWRDWLLRAIAGDPSELQIVYGLDGARRLPEADIPWLSGYEGSQPVRTGNAAAPQLQLDVWGEVLDGLSLTRAASPDHAVDTSWDIQVALMEYLEGAWNQPDNGLWEMRGPRRHFTHSKVMAWVAADRMVKAVRTSGLPGPADRWAALRREIHADVMEKGFDEKLNTFVQSYGSTELDASLLLIPRVGFLPHRHPRVAGTVGAIQKGLTDDGLVLRYRTESGHDGLPGDEGVFLACSFWLVDALLGIERKDEATQLFERLLSLRNDVGLLSEEWDPRTQRHLGNTPQAFSHFPLIHSALQLHEGEAHSSDTPLHKPRHPERSSGSTLRNDARLR